MEKVTGEMIKNAIRGKGLTMKEAAKKIDVSRQTLHTQLTRAKPDEDFIQKVKTHLNLEFKNTPVHFEGTGIPYLGELDVFAGSTDIANMDLSEYITEFISIPGFRDANYFVNVRGHSMYPKYAAGEIIAIKRIFDYSEIQFGQAYVVVTPENRVIKSIRKAHSKEKWILESCNKEFDNYEIDVKKVKALFLVLGKITKDVL